MSRGRDFLIAQRPGDPIGPPPDRFTADQIRAWHDVIASVPADAFRHSDGPILEITAACLDRWRAGHREAGFTRTMYGLLGACFVPMRERRRLLFPERRQRQ